MSKSRRGFASMPHERRQSIAADGGRRAHALKRAHEWDADEAAEAGRKGGKHRWRQRHIEQLDS